MYYLQNLSILIIRRDVRKKIIQILFRTFLLLPMHAWQELTKQFYQKYSLHGLLHRKCHSKQDSDGG